MSLFFTSDTHIGHRGNPNKPGDRGGIIGMAKRPYKTIEEHDEDLIRRWNAKVGPDDTVWHLGDFAMGDQTRVPQIVARLNGRINLCWGNHDHQRKYEAFRDVFASIQDVAIVDIDKHNSVFLSHYAHRVWPRSHRGRFHFFGHSHGGTPPIARSIDVGVDCWNYEPVTFAEIVKRLKSLNLYDVVVKHHGEGSTGE